VIASAKLFHGIYQKIIFIDIVRVNIWSAVLGPYPLPLWQLTGNTLPITGKIATAPRKDKNPPCAIVTGSKSWLSNWLT
jgi:hypothetical protein